MNIKVGNHSKQAMCQGIKVRQYARGLFNNGSTGVFRGAHRNQQRDY
jgi:hypothetical protein